MKRPRRLSAAFVRTVNKPGRYGEGRGGFGLSLLVKERKGGGRLGSRRSPAVGWRRADVERWLESLPKA